MSTRKLPANVIQLRIIDNTESLDELFADENCPDELIELINQSFVLEVETSHAQEYRTSISKEAVLCQNKKMSVGKSGEVTDQRNHWGKHKQS